MLCVERMHRGRLPTICEYEPRCPRIVINLCNTEVPKDVPDNASRQTLRKDIHCNDKLVNVKPAQTTANARDFDKSKERANGLGSTKVRCVKDYVELITGESQKINSSKDSQSDNRNKTISPSCDTSQTFTYKVNDKKDNQRDIRNAKINPNSSSILHRIACSTMQESNNRDNNNNSPITEITDKPCMRNKKPSLVIPHILSDSPAVEPWRAVVMMTGSDQVRVWARDYKHLVVEAVTKDYSQSGTNSQEVEQTDRKRCKLISEGCNDIEKKSIFEDYQTHKSFQHLITIPEQISLNSLMATLSTEGQLIIKEIRHHKPSSGKIVVIPIEKNVKF